MTAAVTTLAEVVRRRAEQEGDRIGFTFLREGELGGAEDLTYAELDRRARVVGGFLQERRMLGKPAYLLHGDGIPFPAALAGCAYAGAIAVPMYGPDRGRERARTRLEAATERVPGGVVLTTAAERASLRRLLDESERLRALDVVATDELDPRYGDHYRAEAIAADQPAFLLATSGSTGSCRFVAVTHENALAQCAFLSAGFGYREDSIHVGWPPVCNTGGFVFTVLNPICTGFRSVRLPAVAFLGKPVRWLQAITHYRGTHGHGPNFAYDLCAKVVTLEEKAHLDLASWRHAINGAEPVRPDTLEQFTRAFEACGFRWGAFSLSYGLSEATMQVARSGRADGPVFYRVDSGELQRSGRAIAAAEDAPRVRRLPRYSGHGELHRRILIVDPQTRTELPAGGEGEIWVAGDDVTGAYLGDVEETAEAFGQHTSDGRGPFLRTGDLGFMVDGDLCVSGRLKDVIIIRGANHDPTEFEWSAGRSHPSLAGGSCAAFAAVVGVEERLVVVAEPDAKVLDTLDAIAVAKGVRAAIARDHLIHVWGIVLVRPGGLPRTPNGKIQRRACRAAYLGGTLPALYEAGGGASADLHEPGVLEERR
jgi:acyl-CoA synthetase (AMP-forming)/AMP-acid ligase II